MEVKNTFEFLLIYFTFYLLIIDLQKIIKHIFKIESKLIELKQINKKYA